jgi:hypothetical protein
LIAAADREITITATVRALAIFGFRDTPRQAIVRAKPVGRRTDRNSGAPFPLDEQNKALHAVNGGLLQGSRMVVGWRALANYGSIFDPDPFRSYEGTPDDTVGCP